MSLRGIQSKFWAIIVIAAFFLRALVPTDYMLVSDPQTQGLRLAWCSPTGSPPPTDWQMPISSSDLPNEDDEDTEHSSCFFALSGLYFASTNPMPIFTSITPEKLSHTQFSNVNLYLRTYNPATPATGPPLRQA